MTTNQKIKAAKKLKKGHKFSITHCDGVVVNEVVSHIKIEREENEHHTYHPTTNSIHHTCTLVKHYVFVVCESGAVYEPNEIGIA